MIYTYQHNGESYSVNLEAQPDGSYIASIGERQYVVQAEAVADGWLLQQSGQRARVYTAALNNERFIHVEGQAYTLTVPDARSSRRRQAGSGADALTAKMPGQVLDVRVAEGDSVEKGQTLVIMEAMKMEIRVAAPTDGRIRRIHVAIGDVVDREQLLVEMEASASA